MNKTGVQVDVGHVAKSGRGRHLLGSRVLGSYKWVISPLIGHITIATLPITPLITTHEPPGFRGLGFRCLGVSGFRGLGYVKTLQVQGLRFRAYLGV